MPRSSGTYSLPSGNPVVSGTVISTTWANNTLNDVANELTNSIPRDGSAPPTANVPLGNFKLTGIGAATLTTDVPQYQQIQSGATNYLTSVSGTNTIVATLATPTLAAYITGQHYTFVSTGTNTGATTLNINSLGAKTVQKDGAALAAGDITSGKTYEVIYDGTNLQLLSGAGINAASIQNQTYEYFTTGGTSTAYTLTPSPALASLTTGHRFNVNFNATAGATPTLAISGLTAKSLKLYNSVGAKVAASATTIISGMIADVEYDGTDYVILNQLPTVSQANAVSSDVTARTSSVLTVTPASLQGLSVSGTNTATTSGTSIDFTGLPSWVTRITLMFDSVSTNGTQIPIVQIGDSGGVETSGYLSSSSVLSASTTSTSATNGFAIFSNSAAAVVSGALIITLKDSATQTWVCTGVLMRSDTVATITVSGVKALSPGPLDRIRLTTATGADTFDAGSINIRYE